jgi:hypothetical protein
MLSTQLAVRARRTARRRSSDKRPSAPTAYRRPAIELHSRSDVRPQAASAHAHARWNPLVLEEIAWLRHRYRPHTACGAHTKHNARVCPTKRHTGFVYHFSLSMRMQGQCQWTLTQTEASPLRRLAASCTPGPRNATMRSADHDALDRGASGGGTANVTTLATTPPCHALFMRNAHDDCS